MGDLGKLLCLSSIHFLSYQMGMITVPLDGSKMCGWHVFGLCLLCLHPYHHHFSYRCFTGRCWCYAFKTFSTLVCVQCRPLNTSLCLVLLYHLQNKKFLTIVLETLTPVFFFNTFSFLVGWLLQEVDISMELETRDFMPVKGYWAKGMGVGRGSFRLSCWSDTCDKERRKGAWFSRKIFRLWWSCVNDSLFQSSKYKNYL